MIELEEHSWKLTFHTREDEDHCEMVVHLNAGDRALTGHGKSSRNPTDPSVPQVGEELAAARALHDLANHLTEDAWKQIEAFPVAIGSPS
ncbi:MAG: dsRBD fold-containing protein [Acidimicrobiales bacterium]